MGARQSKGELLYEQVNSGNIEGIKALHSQGASLEWVNEDGKRPLMLACSRHDLFNVAKVLLELGANVNAYRPGSFSGTPLHHAADKGLERTVHLLISNGADPFVMNDDHHKALDLAREKGHLNVVRAIEGRICVLSCWLREDYGPGFLLAVLPQFSTLMTKKIWAVVLPCESHNLSRTQKFELIIYSDVQDAKPVKKLQLSKCYIEEPEFSKVDPQLTIIENSTRVKHKFLSGNEGDKQQLRTFYTACRGMPIINLVPMPTPPPIGTVPASPPAVTVPQTQQSKEEMELAMAINASIQSALIEGVPVSNTGTDNGTRTTYNSNGTTYNGWIPPSPKKTHTDQASTSGGSHDESTQPATLTKTTNLAPSAPPTNEQAFYSNRIQYPSIDSTPTNISTAATTISNGRARNNEDENMNKNSENDVCVICLDARLEGVCIPCGHMAGCMACLKEIEEKRGECPICRTKINQVLKVYHV